MTFVQRQQTVDGDAGGDALLLQACHLVGHECDEWRDDHGERAGPVILGKRRQLIAERLAGAGREDSEHRRLGQRRRDDGLLQGASILAGRLRPEPLEAEPLFEKARRVAPGPAPVAGRIRAGRVAEPSDENAGLGKLVPDPGRHDGVLARDRDPGERVGERPAGALRFRGRQLDLVGAGPPGENLPDHALRLRGGWPRRIPYQSENCLETLRILARCRQPVEGRQQIGIVSSEFSKLGELVLQHGEDEAGIEFRVAGLPGPEPSVLIVLDQAVIRVAGKGERVEPEGVDRRFCKDLQTGMRFPQIGQVVVDHVMSEHELRAGGVLV